MRTVPEAARLAGLLCLTLLAWTAPTNAQTLLDQIVPSGDAETPVEAQLIADTSAVSPGTTFTLGVLLKLKPDWHVYWTNPGEVGYATTFQWSLPDKAMKAGPLQYPLPERFVSPGPLNSFGYAHEVLLMSEVAWEGSGAPGTATDMEFRAKGKWLMCSDRCIPGKAEVTLKLPVGKPKPANEELFSRYRRLVPKPGAGSEMVKVKTAAAEGGASVIITVTPSPGRRLVAADNPPTLRGAYFYPDKVPGFEVTVPTVSSPDTTVKTTTGEIPVFAKPFTIEFRLLAEKRLQQAAAHIGGVLVTQTIGPEGKPAEPVAEIVTLTP